jgi:geranylgeranyl diphosphate synthase type II
MKEPRSLIEIQQIIAQEFEALRFVKEPELLYQPIDYILSLGGKRMRPALCLMSCEIFDGNISEALNPAMGLEIFHNFTLLHDDIMDRAPIRRGKATVHKKWNDNVAILSGDTMMALSYEYIMKAPEAYRSIVFSIFNKTAIEVCEGQQFDMNFETQTSVSITDYLEMIRLKTAVLLAASLKIGAIIAGASEKDAHKLYSFGEQIGLAFQLKDDLLDVFSDVEKFGKQSGGDILTNKKTFLYLKAFELASDKTYESLWYYFTKDFENEKEKIDGVKAIYEELNIKGITESEMKKYYNSAIQLLDEIEINPLKKTELRKFADQLMVRES